MRPLLLESGTAEPAGLAARLAAAWGEGRRVGIASAAERDQLRRALGEGPAEGGGAVVLGSGGSTGGRRWCLLPLAHLEASAAATGVWLAAQGIDPAAAIHLNPLPLHHVSGLLPLVRCRLWGAELRWLPPPLLRRPAELEAESLPRRRPLLLSLVPTQLARLMAEPEGMAWLGRCTVIWVGGAALPADLAARARAAGLPLAPCYGATETAAMVCALPPRRFLAGDPGCGPPLEDVELRIAPGGQALEVRTPRLSPGFLEGGRLRPLPGAEGGWWRSGDGARLGAGAGGRGVEILGRLDGALHSGGETVFPEVLEARLRAAAAERGLPLAAVLVLGQEDAEWGQRLVALVRPSPGAATGPLLEALRRLTTSWPPAERPRRWLPCPSLAASAAGKWERLRWGRWLRGEGSEGTDP